MDTATAVRAAATNRLPAGWTWHDVRQALHMAARRYRAQTQEQREKLREGA